MVELSKKDEEFKLPHAAAFSPTSQREQFENWIMAHKDDRPKKVNSPDLIDETVLLNDALTTKSITQMP